jgi:hypothetical protein
VKALSLTQPWASALFMDLKHYETRSWTTRYRGPLLIHAAKGFPKYARTFVEDEQTIGGRNLGELPLGALLGRIVLVDVVQTYPLCETLSAIERLYGDYSVGRFAWKFNAPILFATPVPYKGQLGLFEVPDNLRWLS